MSTHVSNKIQTQSVEETMLVQKKQGIVTILAGSDFEQNIAATASSLRRTLSADMSSKKWLSQNESSYPMKKIASSEELSYSKTVASAGDSSSSSEGEEEEEEEEEEERERLEIWSSIQRNKKEEQEKSGQIDYIWSSIMSLKETSKSLPATPYVHPLVKRSKSSLSEKSLQICTESLGSETGSDGFSSSYPPSESGEDKEEAEQDQQTTEKETEHAAYEIEEELQMPKYKYAAKKSLQRSFPPPLPSLSHRQDGPSLHMRPCRDNGRLVLEAISVPSQNNFSVQRQDGRLVLTFANHEESKEDADEVDDENEEKYHLEELEEEEFEGVEEEDDLEEKEHEKTEEDETEDVESVIEEAPVLSSGVSSVQRLAMMVNKQIGLVNRNPKWSEKFNEVVNLDEQSSVAQSLPPRPRVARLIPSSPSVASAAVGASFNFNAYEYYWRSNPASKAGPNPLLNHEQNSLTLKNGGYSSKLIVSGDNTREQQVLVLRGKNGDYLVHNFKSCKGSRRSFLLWEPYCIATS